MGKNKKSNAANLEVNTRAKLIKSAKDHLARMYADRNEAIRAINAKRPVDKARAVREDYDAKLTLEASANVKGEDQFAHWLGEYDKRIRTLERHILAGEAMVKGELKGYWDIAGDMQEGDEDDEEGED